MNVTPVAVSLTLSDQVIVEEGTRKVSLIGTFSRLTLKGFPGRSRPFSVFALFTDGLGEGTISLVVSRLDTGEEVFSHERETHFSDRLTEVRYHFRFNVFTFPVPGLYLFTLLIDGDWVAQRRLLVQKQEEHR